MSMNSHGGMTYPAQSLRVEERVFGVAYERASAMVPKLVAQTMGVAPEELTDGFFEVTADVDWGSRREMTVRLAREGADTRVVVRVVTRARWQAMVAYTMLLFGTVGLVGIVLLPWMIAATRKENRARELLVHRTFRAFEDAVAQQAEAGNYRVAPGLDAITPDAEVEPEAAELRTRSSPRPSS